jgi:serine/threonine protein kinase
MPDISSAWEQPLEVLLVMALVVVGVYVAIKLVRGVFWVIGQVLRGIGRFAAHVFEFVASMARDVLRLVGSVLAAAAYLPALGVSVLFVRRSAALHYGRALRDEATRFAGCLYRLAIGNLVRLLCLDAVTEGLEQRVPEVIARAPGRPSSGPASFPGYRVTGSLPGGGSGARLYLAEPDDERRRQLARASAAGTPVPEKVVIKSFSLAEGSTLPQIVRENRALSAARELGLVLEHELTATRFHYVMPYVPGEDLASETSRLHAASGSGGLRDAELARALALTDDLLSALERFHRGGLWHKDVKPGNVIVSGGRAHLVDFGLITPLASALTLTTHGTEYFRDPEMVRLALKGAKVHEVDGIKFDVYGAGAVLFSLIEGSFPAHGSLSRLTRRCPEALRWVIRRAMADMQQRYASASEMLADLRAVSGAADPFAVRPADLPSLAGKPHVAEALAQPVVPDGGDVAGAVPFPTPSFPAVPMPAASIPATSIPAASTPAPGDSGAAAPPRGVPVHGRRLRPLEPPYGERRWSRRAVGAAMLVVALLVFRGDDRESSRRPRVERRDTPLVSSVEHVPSRGAAVAAAQDARADEELALAVLREGSIEMLEPVSLQSLEAHAADVPPLPLPPAGLVLVLDDLPASAPPERVAAVEALRKRLRAARYALLGCARDASGAAAAAPGLAPGLATDAAQGATPGVAQDAAQAVAQHAAPDAAQAAASAVPGGARADGALAMTGIDPTAEVELLAGARAAVGLSDPSDPEAVARLSAFLKAQGDQLDAILWIGRAGEDAPVQTRVFARSDAAADELRRLLGGRRDR